MVVELVAPRVARGMEVPDVGHEAADRTDHVALHDLHVIDVVQQLDARTAYHLAQRQPPVAAVGKIAGMVHLAVEQFQVEVDAVLLGAGRHAAQHPGALHHTLVVALTVQAVAGEADQPRHPVRRRQLDCGAQLRLDAIMVGRVVAAARQGSVAGEAGHHQPVPGSAGRYLGHGEFILGRAVAMAPHLHRPVADGGGRGEQLIQRGKQLPEDRKAH